MSDVGILAVQLGFAATEADVEAARTQTHDKLIADLEDRRRSGVTWRTFPASEALDMLEEIGIDTTRGDVNEWITAYPNGFLIIASAEAVVA